MKLRVLLSVIVIILGLIVQGVWHAMYQVLQGQFAVWQMGDDSATVALSRWLITGDPIYVIIVLVEMALLIMLWVGPIVKTLKGSES